MTTRSLWIYFACLGIAAISCSGEEPSSITLSKARAKHYRTLEKDTEGKVRKITTMFQVAIDSNGNKTKVYDGYLIQYTYTVNDSTIKGMDRTRYRDFPMLGTERAIDSMMRNVHRLIIRYDEDKPTRSLVNLERTFSEQESE